MTVAVSYVVSHAMSHRQRGFTLIEILITVVIIGIAIGTATAMLRFSPQKLLDQETERLWQLFSLAQEQARTQGHVYGWQLTGNQYQFVMFDVADQRWFAVTESPLQARSIDERVQVDLQLKRTSQQQKKSAANSDKDQSPEVLFFPNGESTPFKLMINLRDEALDIAQLSWLENDGVSGIYLSTVDTRYHE
jgi:general secretion pathway protein H